jgi:hypothetical protein
LNCNVGYLPASATNQNVTATLTGCNKTPTVTNNNGSFATTFTGNGSFTFQFRDAYGNTGTKTVSVNWIDKTAPTISSVTPFPTAPTSGSVTVTVNASDGGAGLHASAYSFDNGNSWQSGQTKAFTGNQTVKVKVRDAVGNISSASDVIISNIDTEKPI